MGICSYLLVNFWFTRLYANESSYSAFITNRIGDSLLTVGMFTIAFSLGNLDYASVFSFAPLINENLIVFIGICLLIGAMAKSSQVGLHVWLPLAMEGPTPVSALIHAATMVIRYKRHISSKCIKNKLHPWFITGFTDGEGSFSIRIRTKSNSQLGFNISIVYSICAEVNPLNLKLLELVKHYFGGVGSISKSNNMYYYEISSIKSLISVRKHQVPEDVW